MSRAHVEGFVGERRQASRRRMPADVRALLLRLASDLRRPGAATADGIRWRTVRAVDLEAACLELARVWAPDPEVPEPQA